MLLASTKPLLSLSPKTYDPVQFLIIDKAVISNLIHAH